MNELQVFQNAEFGKVRTVVIDNEPWLVGKDVASILGYSDTFGALKKHVDNEDKQNCQNDSFESPRGMTIINESGLYALVFGSKLPSAKRFKHWVTSEVLPTIRKKGSYQSPEQPGNVRYMIPKTFSQALHLAANLQAKIEEDAPLVAYASAVMVSDDCITVGTLAKIIEQKYHINIGRSRLFAKLREDGILMKAPRGHKDHNRPTQKAMDAGWFALNGASGTSPSGKSWENFTPYVTPKGRIALVDKYGRQAAEKQMALEL